MILACKQRLQQIHFKVPPYALLPGPVELGHSVKTCFGFDFIPQRMEELPVT